MILVVHFTCWRIVVFDGASTISTIVPSQISGREIRATHRMKNWIGPQNKKNQINSQNENENNLRVLLGVLVPALGAPPVHNAWWVCGLLNNIKWSYFLLSTTYHKIINIILFIILIEGRNSDRTVTPIIISWQWEWRWNFWRWQRFQTSAGTFNSAEHSHLAEIFAQWRHLLQPCDCEQ